ncbi:MAG: TRAP transporter large permease [Tropicimonas sp.]|uniref:TRAP transporter large permease n=1 Tax=Tropicimonas sp. TaxID=2067044 RepID=UPI003A899C87
MLAISLSLVFLIFGLLAAGQWVGLALIIAGSATATLFSSIPVDRLIPQYAYNIFTTSELIALPLYILMGEILFRTRLAEALFSGLAPWAGLLPGRLLHMNVLACSIFAAISGSSAATAQVVGKMSLSELLRRGYSPAIATGSLAGAGTLGFLIPPSTVMIIYGVLANQSILRLFAGGLIPGMLLALIFMSWIMIHCTVRPESVPESERALDNLPLRERISALSDLAPVVFLILCVLGSMYAGLATPSEAAAIGVVGAFLVAWRRKGLDRAALYDILMSAVQTSAMMGLIIMGATILGNINSFLGVPTYLAQVVDTMELTPFALILVLLVVYLILGCFLEGFSIIVTTLPVVLPLVVAAGFDPVWFGIFLVIVVEMAQITPPLGFNLFIIQSLTGTPLTQLTRNTMPYLIIMVGFVLILAIFPNMVLWLPSVLYD